MADRKWIPCGNPLVTLGFGGERTALCNGFCQTFWSVARFGRYSTVPLHIEWRPCQGGAGGWGSHVARLNFKTSRVGVYNACRLLSALPSLLQFGRGRLLLVAISFYALSLLFRPCRLSEFTLAGPQKKPMYTTIWSVWLFFLFELNEKMSLQEFY